MRPLGSTGRVFTAFENGGAVLKILFACIRELQAFCLADEQFHLQRIFKPTQMMTQRCLGDVVGERGARQAPGPGDLPESSDVFQAI